MKDEKPISREQKEALVILLANRSELSRQQFKTFKGQIMSGDTDGFRKGLQKILARE